MMKIIPGYKDTVKGVTQKAVDNLEVMFKKRWEDEGDLQDGESDVYNNRQQ